MFQRMFSLSVRKTRFRVVAPFSVKREAAALRTDVSFGALVAFSKEAHGQMAAQSRGASPQSASQRKRLHDLVREAYVDGEPDGAGIHVPIMH